MYKKISDYGVIGNCRTAALVASDGSIDWAALPNFDSPAYFCSILDSKKGGFFKIAPEGFYKSDQSYIYHTNILETLFFNQEGSVLLSDFMPLSRDEEETNSIPEFGTKFVRRLKALKGSHRINLTLKITPDFAKEKVEVFFQEGLGLIADNRENTLVLWTERKPKIEDRVVYLDFDLKEGETALFALGFFRKGGTIPAFGESEFRSLFNKTARFWRWWAGICQYKGMFYEEVIRSALVLKLLTYNPTGAVVASPTTSLPEKIGGFLNWDYRYTWLRDASLIMYSLLALGYLKEASEFMRWLENVAVKEEEGIRIMYGINGERELKETDLDHLEGYLGSKPVRIGNAASNQKQFDVFGEALATINLYVQCGGSLSPKMKSFVKRLVEYCALHWKEADAGIWEGRGDYKHHTYSKLMAWVGMDRGIRIAKKLGIDADFDYWQAVRDEIKVDLLENGFNKKLGAFVESYGSDIIDASNLNISLVGFLAPDDPTMLSTLEKTMSTLTKDWFVLRTSNEKDELKNGEGAFFLTTFWLIDNLSLLGRVKEAKIWLEKVLHFATPLGLYAEEFDPYTKEHLGNFPMGFTHLGLINSVLTLDQVANYGQRTKETIPAERLVNTIGQVLLTGGKRTRKTVEDVLEIVLPGPIKGTLLKDSRRKTKNN
ncbi:MAG: glycoside hydrolase family 15 protein [Candidatus Woykebacteria bacterium]